jgi:hypothetical protein
MCMRRLASLALAALVAVTVHAQNNPNQLFIKALTGINATNTASITYSGTGTAPLPAAAGKKPGVGPVAKYTVSINYGMTSSMVEIDRATEPKHVVQYFADGKAWDVVDKRTTAVPAEAAGRERLIWLTPHGILKAAFDPAAKRQMATEPGPDGKPVTTMTFLIGTAQYKAYLPDTALIDRVQTMPGDPQLGSAMLEISFSDYKDYNGIKFPTRIVQKHAGDVVLDLTVTEVRPNAGLYVEVPESVAKSKT